PPAPVSDALHPVLVRDGALSLFATRAGPVTIADGEVIPLAPGRAPVRDPLLGRGLPERKSFVGLVGLQIVAFAGTVTEPRAAYLVVSEDMLRGEVDIHTYRLGDRGWGSRDRKRGELTEYYADLLETPEGAVLGLRHYNLQDAKFEEEDDEDPESVAYWAQVRNELAAAPPGFVPLLGKPARVPHLPPGWTLTTAVATSDGRVVGLGRREDERQPSKLLLWGPEEVLPDKREIPGLSMGEDDRWELGLWAVGTRVLLGGEENGRPYLALGEGETWAEIPVTLPEPPTDLEGPEASRVISSATMTTGGELWITTGEWFVGEVRPATTLWRRGPGNGEGQQQPAWEGVSLAPVQFPSDAAARKIFDPVEDQWVEIPAAGPSDGASARKVLWASDTLWVLADLGPIYGGRGELAHLEESRNVVYASRAAPLTELPSIGELARERGAGDE
ncbi:MAG: hypothetical protein KC431_20500, partial [Myxococcales bacterium]|nr:hypothetical protein [Myxococcales bacterium]